MDANELKRVARPPKFSDPAVMQEQIDAYFKSCEGKVLTDNEGNPVISKYGTPIIYGEKQPTYAGLAFALGFKSRQGLYYYKGKKEFQDVMDRALLRLEVSTEERLFDKEGSNGAKFSLQNNFRGWTDAAKEIAREGASAPVQIVCDIPRKVQTEVIADAGSEQ